MSEGTVIALPSVNIIKLRFVGGYVFVNVCEQQLVPIFPAALHIMSTTPQDFPASSQNSRRRGKM